MASNPKSNKIKANKLGDPNVDAPNADGAPKPGVCVGAAVGAPNAGGAADVAGVLNEKFPNAANGSNAIPIRDEKNKHNQ